MALIPNDRWPAQTNAPSADYPHGSAPNQSVPGDNTGTPLTKDWINDLWGFLQALLTRGGVAPDGLPDTAQVSQYLEALRKSVTLQDAYDASLVHSITGTGIVESEGGGLPGTMGLIRASMLARLLIGDGYAITGSQTEDSTVAAFLEAVASGAIARLWLAGATRSILGRDVDGDPAPVSVPNGLAIGDGVGHAPQYTYLGTQVFTSNGMWTRPDSCRAVKVTCVGGGGGSGGAQLGNVSGGGGGGGSAIAWITGVGSAAAVVVGAGGSGGSATGNGSPGGDSFFGGTLCSASGGGGSLGNRSATDSAGSAPGGSAGNGTNGDVLLRGGDGGESVKLNLIAVCGGGGGSKFGGHTCARILPAGTGDTRDGGVYGNGGSGVTGNTGGQPGSAGAPGIVIVEEYA